MKNTLILSSLAAITATYAQPVVLDGNVSEVTALGSGQYEITSDYTFPSEVILEGTTYIASGVTVTINAGTIVRGQPVENSGDTPGALVASRGATLIVAGTNTNPVIMTTAADANRGRWSTGEAFLDADPKNAPLAPFSGSVGNSELWGALTLCGYAPTNCGTAATGVAGENYVEGFPVNSARNTYGGSLPNDSSGSIQYVSIRHTGETITEGNEQQGLTLAGVGAGTVIENVDIYCSGDDGIEIFGGSANLRNVMISYVNDDGFDLDQGWTGNAQNVFVLANNINSIGNITTASVAEWDGEDGDNNTSAADVSGATTLTGQPFTAPTMYNFTFFCDGVSGTAATIDTNFGGNLFNTVWFEIANDGFSISDNGNYNPRAAGFGWNGVGDRLTQGSFNISSNTFIGATSSIASEIGASATADSVLANSIGNCDDNVVTTGNPFFFGAANGGVYNDQTAANGVNPAPLTGATTNVVAVVGPFFEQANQRGAFQQSSTAVLWTTGWTAMNVRGILVDAGNGANVVN